MITTFLTFSDVDHVVRVGRALVVVGRDDAEERLRRLLVVALGQRGARRRRRRSARCRPALNVLLVAATEPEVEPPMTPTMFLSATNFCATVCAADGPCSTGASPGTSLIFRPIVVGSVLTASLRPGELLLAEEAGTTRERGEHADRERARAADRAARAGSSRRRARPTTVAASAVAAATAANSGNDLAFFMYELLLGGIGAIRSLRRIGRRMQRCCWRPRRRRRQAAVSASTQLRVSVNWWKRTALPSGELPDVRERDVERLARGLGARRCSGRSRRRGRRRRAARRARRRSPPTTARRSGRRPPRARPGGRGRRRRARGPGPGARRSPSSIIASAPSRSPREKASYELRTAARFSACAVKAADSTLSAAL